MSDALKSVMCPLIVALIGTGLGQALGHALLVGVVCMVCYLIGYADPWPTFGSRDG